jgi:hypothetical protein
MIGTLVKLRLTKRGPDNNAYRCAMKPFSTELPCVYSS